MQIEVLDRTLSVETCPGPAELAEGPLAFGEADDGDPWEEFDPEAEAPEIEPQIASLGAMDSGGTFGALNTWDNQIVSWGMAQFAGHAGTLANLLWDRFLDEFAARHPDRSIHDHRAWDQALEDAFVERISHERRTHKKGDYADYALGLSRARGTFKPGA